MSEPDYTKQAERYLAGLCIVVGYIMMIIVVIIVLGVLGLLLMGVFLFCSGLVLSVHAENKT